MDVGSRNKYPAGALSNFTPNRFMFRGVECNSMEGLLQSLKFKNPDMQKYVCTLTGMAAKRKGSRKNWQRDQVLWWNGEHIERDSKEYQELLDEAYIALTQSKKFCKALLATQKAVLTHSIGKSKISDTVLTESEFCYRLTILRLELQNDLGIMVRRPA